VEVGDIEGHKITQQDVYVALAHPLSRELSVPPPLRFNPHLRLIAESHWRHSAVLRRRALEADGLPTDIFDKGAETLVKLKVGTRSADGEELEMLTDVRSAWDKCVRTFEVVCEKLFREKDPKGLTYINIRDGRRSYFTSKDLQFLIGVGLRALIEECWKPHRRVLLIGVVKDSQSRYFYRNYLGSLHVLESGNVQRHLQIHLPDRSLLELLRGLDAPWATVEYDSCFMTLLPSPAQGGWAIRGYPVGNIPEVTRPPRLFLRSLAQFLLRPDTGLSSHVIFIDRPAYPGWDPADSEDLDIETPGLGRLKVLRFRRPPKLQYLSMYLLSVLVRNHFPEALGYPEPLHKADWGARSMRERVSRLLDSAWIAERSNPLRRTFREIRDSFGRGR
jgi:hypothetical protein